MQADSKKELTEMPKSTKSKPGAAPDPLNLPALKKRYDELKAKYDGGIEASVDALKEIDQYSDEFHGLERLLIAKGLLPKEPKSTTAYEDLEKRNHELTAELKELRAKLAERSAREERLELVRRVMRLEDYELDLAGAALKCIDRTRGCDTPGEEFVNQILLTYAHGPLTPEKAETDLNEFRENYKDMIRSTRAFLAANPGVANETSDAA